MRQRVEVRRIDGLRYKGWLLYENGIKISLAEMCAAFIETDAGEIRREYPPNVIFIYEKEK